MNEPDLESGGSTAPQGSSANPSLSAGDHVACCECGTVLPRWKMQQHSAGWLCPNCQSSQAPVHSPPLPSSFSGSTYAGNQAGFWIRVAARLLDILFIGVLVIVTAVVIIFTAGNKTIFLLAAILAIPILYLTLTVGSSSTTFGKRICGLSLATAKGYPVGYLRAFWRIITESLGWCASILVFFYFEGDTPRSLENNPALVLLLLLLPLLTYLVVLLNPSKRGIHDYLAGTRVVKV